MCEICEDISNLFNISQIFLFFQPDLTKRYINITNGTSEIDFPRFPENTILFLGFFISQQLDWRLGCLMEEDHEDKRTHPLDGTGGLGRS